MCSLVQAEKWDGDQRNKAKGGDRKIKKIKEWAAAVGDSGGQTEGGSKDMTSAVTVTGRARDLKNRKERERETDRRTYSIGSQHGPGVISSPHEKCMLGYGITSKGG